MSRVYRAFVVFALTTTSLALCASAQAQVVVGQTAPSVGPLISCTFTEPTSELQIAVQSGPSYVVPNTGAITSWSTLADVGPGQMMTFKVFRKVAPFTYLVVAQDTRALAPSLLNSFPVAIPVQAGDVIGESQPGGNVPSPCAFETGLPGDLIMYAEGTSVPAGGTVTFPGSVESEYRLNVSATVLPSPTVTSISPAKGSIKGATVTIAGTNFASVTGVSFGSVPATKFTVVSESQITAVAPSTSKLTKAPVSVTTAAGAASSPQAFAYEGCKVPNLAGKKLKAAKKALKKADCKLGKATKTDGVTAKTGKVVKQNPKPTKILAPGSKVGVKLG